MPCLDTNILIGALNRDQSAITKIENLVASKEKITTTSVNIYELYKGAYRSSRPEHHAEKLGQFLRSLTVLDLNGEAAKTAAKILEQLRAEGQTISETDTMIAAIAVTNNQTIVTRDEHFQRIKQLRIETW